MKLNFSRRLLLSALIPSLIFWWAALIFLFDFQFSHILRSKINRLPVLSRLDPMFRETLLRVYNSDIRFSRPLDIFFFPAQLGSSQLPIYYLTVAPQDLTQLNLNMLQALRLANGFLTDQYSLAVPAQVNFQGNTHQGRLKYRGDRPSHWLSSKKSLNLNLDTGQRLNFIIPEERSFIAAALSKHIARKLNLMVQADSYVSLTLNDQNLGIYYQTEELDENFLSRQDKPLGNLYADRYGDVDWSSQIDLFTNPEAWKKKVSHPQQTDDQRQDLVELINGNYDLVDQESFLAWQIHSLLIGNLTQDNQHNIKLYSNPQTGKFEFIVDDISFNPQAIYTHTDCAIFNTSYNRLVANLFKDPPLLKQRNQLLKSYLDNPDNLTDDLNFINQLIDNLTPELRRGIRKSTQLQLSFALWQIPRNLKVWYHQLAYELKACY